MPLIFNSSRMKQMELEEAQNRAFQEREDARAIPAVPDAFTEVHIPPPLPRCPQCGAAVAPRAKRCKHYRASLARK